MYKGKSVSYASAHILLSKLQVYVEEAGEKMLLAHLINKVFVYRVLM